VTPEHLAPGGVAEIQTENGRTRAPCWDLFWAFFGSRRDRAIHTPFPRPIGSADRTTVWWRSRCTGCGIP